MWHAVWTPILKCPVYAASTPSVQQRQNKLKDVLIRASADMGLLGSFHMHRPGLIYFQRTCPSHRWSWSMWLSSWWHRAEGFMVVKFPPPLSRQTWTFKTLQWLYGNLRGCRGCKTCSYEFWNPANKYDWRNLLDVSNQGREQAQDSGCVWKQRMIS